MRRIANGTQISAMPTPPAAVGTPGYGSNGDPAAGIQATIFDAHSWNSVQEEIVRVIEAAGLAPDGSNLSQLLQAMRRMFPSGSVDFITATRSFTVPSDVYRLRIIRVWGAGGGGGGSKNQGSAACGGGAGGYAERRNVPVTPGQVIVATVGLGGTGGEPNTPSDGGTGGSSSFGALVSASGGEGGRAANGVVQITASTGGQGFNADFPIPGKPGATGYALSQTQCFGGLGGAPAWGAGSGVNLNSPGQAGAYPGGGAGGGAYGQPGAAGAPGLIEVEW